jgi:glycosyltransferase involved in cell wall biosynthesis
MKISIIVPCFNSEKTIVSTLSSINSQNYKNYEVVIVDNLSDDQTIDLVKKFNFKNLKVIREKDKGIYDAFNKGISASTGEVIAHLNSDDFYCNSFVLGRVIENFSENTDAVYGNLIYVKENNIKKKTRYWKSSDFKKGSFFKGWSPPHPGFFFRKYLFEKYGKYNLDLGIPADTVFMYNLLEKQKIKSKYINIDLVIMREGGKSNQSLKQIILQNKTLLKSFGIVNNPLRIIIFLFFKFLNRFKQIIIVKFI